MVSEYIHTNMEVEIDDHFAYFDVEGDVEAVEDLNYGADADGNRGTYHCQIEEIDNVTIRDEEGNIVEKPSGMLTERAKEAIKSKFFGE